MWRKWLRCEKLQVHNRYELTSISLCVSDYIPCFQDLIYNTEVYKWWSYVNIIINVFGVNIFNVCIRFIWLNMMYIIHNLYWTTLQCDCDIGPTLRYHKWTSIWSFIFLFSVISECWEDINIGNSKRWQWITILINKIETTVMVSCLFPRCSSNILLCSHACPSSVGSFILFSFLSVSRWFHVEPPYLRLL